MKISKIKPFNINKKTGNVAFGQNYFSNNYDMKLQLANTQNVLNKQNAGSAPDISGADLKMQNNEVNTQKSLQNGTNKKSSGNAGLLKAGLGVLAFGAAVFLICKKIGKVKPIPIVQPEEIFDIDYKKALLKGLGREEADPGILKGIGGKEEFLDFLGKNQDNPEIFRVGENFQNIKNRIFGANMHIHTTNSDGQMSVKELLDISSGYADKYFEKNKTPFFIGITDHNTISGCREAVETIAQNPDKFKNLRVVLGSEVNAVIDDTDIHTLIYGINPYENKISAFFNEQLEGLQKEVHRAIDKANSIYKEVLDKYKVEYTFDDMAKIRSSIKTSPASVHYSMKDYMQFRLIYADLVERNSPLINALKKNNISPEELDFARPKFNIPKDNLKEPYYLNYVDELKKYILKTAKEKNEQCDISSIEKCFKEINPDVQHVLKKLEYKTIASDQPLYTKPVKFRSLDDVLEIFKEENCPCGIAHPCLTYFVKGGIRNDMPATRKVIECAFDKFDKKEGLYKKLFEGEYSAYYDNISEECKDFVRKLGKERGFLASGGYDSHRNNPFTNETHLAKEVIEEFIK